MLETHRQTRMRLELVCVFGSEHSAEFVYARRQD